MSANASDIGLNLNSLQKGADGFHAKINGKLSFCVFKKTGSNYIGRVIDVYSLYYEVPVTILLMLISLITVTYLLVKAVVRYMNKYVVMKINDVNVKLKSITDGNLEERVDIRSSAEFSELSNYVNSMVKSLLENNKKMSYVLSKTNILIGTYEYGGNSQKVRYTEYMPKILSIDNDSMKRLALSPDEFAAYLDGIKKNPVPDEYGVYRHGEQYLRLEEIQNDDEIFGVAVDVTVETAKRIEIEKERDIDVLTDLYNRRGLETKLAQLFSEPETLGYSAVVMIDADGLKAINDTYGHEKGDVYLKKIGQAVTNSVTRNSIAARQGGDEFVLFLYGYESKDELINDIKTLETIQSSSFAALDEETSVPLQFSLGYCLVNGENDYNALLKEADEKMYLNKTERKNNRI